MHAQHRLFSQIIMRQATQFIIPVFQREYRWTEDNCALLWEDILRVGSEPNLPEHFVGSVVYIATEDNAAGFTRWLLIDGQQRITTLTLLLTALRDHIRETGWVAPEDGPTWRRIDSYFLRNTEEEGERKLKLHLRRYDNATLNALITGDDMPDVPSSNVIENYEMFRDLLRDADPEVVYKGINRLVLVDVTLQRGRDDPQLIFESLNSTGVDLSTSDLIRNFILMSLDEKVQTRLHTNYWSKIDDLFRDNDRVFANFIRDYLAIQTRPAKLERADRVYTAFRKAFTGAGHDPQRLEPLLEDLLRRARQYAAFTIGGGTNGIVRPFASLRHLGDVPAILIMQLLEAYEVHKTLPEADLMEAVRLIESYMLRRAVIGAQNKGYSLEFAKVAYRIDDKKPLASLRAALARMPAAYAFPTDAEFGRALTEGDLYKRRVCFHVLDALENRDLLEQVNTAGFSIEHIMPQNDRLHESWRQMLGENWKEVQQTWLHRLGNLTLTGYNSTYSDRPFEEKQTIDNGFRDTPIRLSRELRDLSAWTLEEMRSRGERLAARALKIWPALNADVTVIREMERQVLQERAASLSPDKVEMTADARTLFTALRGRIQADLPEVIEMPDGKSISYHDPDFFLEVIPRKHGLGLLIAIDYNEVDGSDETVRDTTNYSFVTNASYQGGVLINLRDQDQLEQAMRVIAQAHTLISGAG
jgi:predicted transport protein